MGKGRERGGEWTDAPQDRYSACAHDGEGGEGDYCVEGGCGTGDGGRQCLRGIWREQGGGVRDSRQLGWREEGKERKGKEGMMG